MDKTISFIGDRSIVNEYVGLLVKDGIKIINKAESIQYTTLNGKLNISINKTPSSDVLFINCSKNQRKCCQQIYQRKSY